MLSRRKKTFEKLKEKEYEKYLYQIKKTEEKQLDTIVNYRTSTTIGGENSWKI